MQHLQQKCHDTCLGVRNQPICCSCAACYRCSSFYGLEAELSAASTGSQGHSPAKASTCKARMRVSGSFAPGAAAARAAAGASAEAGQYHASVSSSLVASTSFVPFTMRASALLQGHLQETTHRQQDALLDEQASEGDVVGTPKANDAHGAGRTGGRAGAAATAGAAGRKAVSQSPGSTSSKQGSPDRRAGSKSPSRAQRQAVASKGWAHQKAGGHMGAEGY